jgi:V8-like Glu-specific endopeptidase
MMEAPLNQRIARQSAFASGVGFLLVVAPGGTAVAGTIRDDVADSRYTSLAADARYAPVGQMSWTSSGGGYIGSGTLLSSSWVLTAAHCVDDAAATNVRFKVGNVTYGASRWFAHAGWNDSLSAGYDIGLVKLSAPVTNVAPAARFTSPSELGLVGTSAGFGRTGTGLTGDTLAPGTKRAGQNTLDILGSKIGYSSRIVLADFDSPAASKNLSWSPSAAPLAMEYSIAPGDSGGGLFVDVQGKARLAGVHSFGLAYDGTVNSSYGDVFGVTRVTSFNEWIDDMIAVNWSNAAGGSFAAAANWSGTAAPAATDVVGFKTPGAYTVHLTSPAASDRILARAGHVTLDLGGHAYDLTSTSAEGSLIVGKYSGNNAAVTATNGTIATRDVVVGELPGSAGKVTVGPAATLHAAGSAYVGGSSLGAGGTGTLTVQDGGSLNVTGTLQAHAAGTINYDGGTLAAAKVALTGGGRMTLSAGGDKLPQVGSLDITGTSKLDLADNDLILNYTGASPAETVRQYLLAGLAGGSWTGTGITSSAAADDADKATAIGWAEAASLGLDTFLGTAVDATTLLLKYTWYGDANLDGQIGIDDYTLLDRGIARSLTGWVNGDFNYDGSVNAADYLLIDKGYALQTGTLSAELLSARAEMFGEAYVGQLITSVPEPTAALTAALTTTLALARRRRTNAP